MNPMEKNQMPGEDMLDGVIREEIFVKVIVRQKLEEVKKLSYVSI